MRPFPRLAVTFAVYLCRLLLINKLRRDGRLSLHWVSVAKIWSHDVVIMSLALYQTPAQCRPTYQASGCHQGWLTVSYNSVQCSDSSETADQGHSTHSWKNQGCIRPVQQAKGQCGDFKPKGCHHAGTTSLRSQQPTTGIPTRHQPFGRSDTPEVWWRLAYLGTLAHRLSCIGNYPATSFLGPQMYLWTSCLSNQPSPSRWQGSLCEAFFGVYASEQQQHQHTSTSSATETTVSLLKTLPGTLLCINTYW